MSYEVKDNLRKMYAIKFFKSMAFFGAVSIPFFLEWGKISYSGIFFLQTWFMAWIFVLEVPTGAIADCISRKSSIAAGGFIYVAAALVYASAPIFYVFMLGEFLWALATSLISGADKALLYDTLSHMGHDGMSTKIFSNYAAANILGTVIGLSLGSVIAGMKLLPYPDSLALPMMLTAVPGLISAVIALTLHEPARNKSSKKYFALVKDGMKYFVKNRKLRALALNMIIISNASFFMFWFYQSVLGMMGVELMLYGFIAAAFNLFGVFMLQHNSRIEKKLGTKKLLLVSGIVPGIMLIVMGAVLWLPVMIFSTLLIFGMREARIPVFENYMNRHIKSEERATVLSTISMFERLSMVAMYPIVGFLADWSIPNTLIILGVVTIAMAFLTRIDQETLS